MNKQYHLAKKPYLPPRVVAVAFKVELGLLRSGYDEAGPFINDSYEAVSNDGSAFWGTETQSSGSFSTTSYDDAGTWTW